ncbi:L-2-hydroxyglutarate oxidase [Ammoniphilus sp. 3BR4]|uniref:L-2-hydroxyglutarate oxidase n=1 Tax=Ammoniphilus sp. 3BR4 TaxID=3158265 RepID=UPI0034661232
MYDFAIVGGGIVGLSTGMELTRRYPKAKILVLEKEDHWAVHQTGHNSGVIHSGIYYKPGSFKAKFAREGSRSMVEFCQKYGIEHDMCGKVIVATKKEELPLLDNLFQRGLDNGLAITKIGPEELRDIEPHVHGLAAIRVPMAGIVNYKQVSEIYASIIESNGGELRLSTRVERITETNNGVEIETNRGSFRATYIINCAGLHSDRVAKSGGMNTDMMIVPFRGEYYELKPEKRYLVKHLIYPVPNPAFPFLGVHYTRMIGGHVEAGPNAVLAFKREGYQKTDFSLKDLAEVLAYPGFWKIASKYWREGMDEYIRSFSKAAFVRSLQELIPEIRAEDLEPAPAGIRAQALKSDGTLVDDFHIISGKNSIHVCNAPSPAATASIQIGKAVVDRIPEPTLAKIYAIS